MSTLSKKLGQFKQWTGEKFGSTEKTTASEDFKQLEMTTETRKEGIENMASSLAIYAKSLDGKEGPEKKIAETFLGDKKIASLNILGKALIQQGKLHGADSAYGRILLSIGEKQTEVAAIQTDFGSKLRQGLLFDVNELLASVKEFDYLKKKLENRRLDYDAKQNKLNKCKKEKPSLEEEMRAAQYKYEETYSDMQNLMLRFGEKEETLASALIEFAEIQAECFKLCMLKTQALIEILQKEGYESKSRSYAPGSTSLLSKNSSISVNGSQKKLNPIEEIDTETGPKAIANEAREGQAKIISNDSGFSKIIQVKALYNFDGETSDDLAFKKGDIIAVIKEIDESWAIGEVLDDDGGKRRGMFPFNYVERLDNVPNIEMENSGKSKEKRENEITSAIIPSIGVSDIASALSRIKLSKPKTDKSKGNEDQSNTIVPVCTTCGCNDFSQNAFKKGHCNVCFHPH